jgi:hypothetical protein
MGVFALNFSPPSLPQVTVSPHLNELMESGMVKTKQYPTRTIYFLDKQKWEISRQQISGLMDLGSKKPGK